MPIVSSVDTAVQTEVHFVDRGVDTEPLPQKQDVATSTPTQLPLAALPAGWSLGRLAEVPGQHVGQAIPQMIEVVFGPVYNLPDIQRQSLEVLLAFGSAVHQSAARQLHHRLAELRLRLQQAVHDVTFSDELYDVYYQQSWTDVEDFWRATVNWPLPEGLLSRRSTL